MDDEFAFHREERAKELMRREVPRREAVRRARLEFGSEAHFKEEARAAQGSGGSTSCAGICGTPAAC